MTERMKSQVGRAMSDDDILGRIRNVANQLGKAHSQALRSRRIPRSPNRKCYRRFGSVSAALRKAGVEQANHGRRYTEDEIFEISLMFGRTTDDRRPLLRWTGRHRPLAKCLPPPLWRVAKGAESLCRARESEADDNPPPVLTKSPSPGPSPTGQPEAPRQHQWHRNAAIGQPNRGAVRVVRPTPTNVQAEDRRDPSIGLRFKVLQRDRFKCVLCGDHPARNAECVLHVHHVIPWSKGGKTREDNLRTLCATCNVGRGNRFADYRDRPHGALGCAS